MDAEVHSIDELKEIDNGKGKRHRVSDDSPVVKVLSTSPKHLRSPSWHVEIQASSSDTRGTGERSDGYGRKTTNSYLTLELTPSDVVAIINAVMSKGLLKISESKTKVTRINRRK